MEVKALVEVKVVVEVKVLAEDKTLVTNKAGGLLHYNQWLQCLQWLHFQHLAINNLVNSTTAGLIHMDNREDQT